MAFGGLRGTLTGNGASVGASNSIAGSVAVSVGDLVFAVLGQQTALTATTASDNLGNTYTATNAGVDAGNSTGRAYYSRVTVAGTLTSVAVVATSSANDWCGFAAVFEGPFAVSPLDANPANASDTTSPFTCPATGTLAQASELVVAWGAATGSTVWAATSPNLLAGNANNSTNIKVAIGYQVVAATTSVVPVFTAAANPTDDTLGTSSFKRDLTQALTPSLFTNSAGFFTQTVTPGAIALSPSLFTNTNTFFAPTVAQVTNLVAGLFADGDTFFTPTVAAGSVTLTPSLYSDGDTFHSATVGRGAVDLAPSLFSDGDAFHTAALSATYAITAALYSDADTFPSATVTAGAISLTPSLLSDGDTFHTAAVTVGAVALAPALFSDGDTFYSALVATDADALFPDLFADADTFFSATVAVTTSLTPSLFADGDTFYDPSVSVGAVDLAPALYVDADTFFTPSLGFGNKRPIRSVTVGFRSGGAVLSMRKTGVTTSVRERAGSALARQSARADVDRAKSAAVVTVTTADQG